MCTRVDRISAMQVASEQSQVKHRSDGTPIYRFAADKWADETTLQAMLGKLVSQMEELAGDLKRATGKEANQYRSRSLQLQARLMNYQTGIKKIQELTDGNALR